MFRIYLMIPLKNYYSTSKKRGKFFFDERPKASLKGNSVFNDPEVSFFFLFDHIIAALAVESPAVEPPGEVEVFHEFPLRRQNIQKGIG